MAKTYRRARRLTLRVSPLTAAVAAVLGSASIAASAQAQSDRGAGIEEIVVTASRRESSVQEVPFNITAFSGGMLDRQRIGDLADFSRWVPGLTVVDQGARGSNLMTVRGLNVLSLDGSEYLGNTSGETVQTYIGEIPVYLDLRMHDIERVEVLIGPQGTLYGAGTLGGAVRYIPRAPDTEEFSFDLEGNLFSLAHSDGAGFEGNFALNAPLVDDKLAFRAALSWLDDPGFIDYSRVLRDPGVSDPQPDLDDPAAVAANLRRVNDANSEQTLFARASLLYLPTDTVQATFNYYVQSQEAGARTVNHRHAMQTGPYEAAHRFLEPNDRESALLSAEVVVDLGFAELTSATGISEFDEHGLRDQTDLLMGDVWEGYAEFPAFAAYARESAKEERFNQELRLVSTGAARWSWIAGFFYNDFERDLISEEFVPGWPEFADIDVPTGDLEYAQLTGKAVEEQAVFGEVTYRFADRWAATLGGRFFDFDSEESVKVDVPLWGDFGDRQINRAGDDGFLGKMNLAYDVSETALAYLTVSEGYRLGGANSLQECDSTQSGGQTVCALPHEILIEPDTTTNYEVGVHSTLRDGRVNLNAAVYHIDWNDIQTLSTTENGAAQIVVNGGGARTRGAEFSLQARTHGPWSYAASYAYVDAALTADSPGLVNGVDALRGDRLAGVPEHQGSFYANYFRTLANGWDLDVGYGIAFTGDVLTKVGLRNEGEKLGGYALHNASVGIGKDRWTATFYADNLLDKFAETGVRQNQSYLRDVNGHQLRRYFRNVLRPRSVGIEFRYRLGE